jgi:hypothetical protein
LLSPPQAMTAATKIVQAGNVASARWMLITSR